MIRPKQRAVITAALLAALPGAASAASFYIIESSAGRLGNAFAGTASAAEDASTVYFNPAGMTRLDRPTVSVAGHFIMPEGEFTNEGSTTAAGTPLSGPEDTTEESAVVPNFYFSTPLNQTVSVGLGINAPFGLRSSYDDDWVGRYHATDSELETININPTLAFQATKRLSLGVGINYQRIDATLENEVDSFVVCVAARQAAGDPTPQAECGANTATGPNPDQQGPGNREADSSVEITGDDRGIGLDLGLIYEFDTDTRVGLSWRQGIEYTLEGEADFDRSAACDASACGAALMQLSGDVTADVELPDILTLSATHGIGEHWRLDADVAWYQWDSIQALRIVRPNGQEVSTLELEYENTTRYALGATYSGLGATTLRTGIAYDETPISSAETVTPRIPDGDRTWITFGLNYAFSPTASLDVGYAHLFVDEVRIENTEQGNTLRGEFDPTVDILSVAANWRF